MKPIFCAAADDDTGATDLAGMLSGEGLRTVLVIEGPVERWAEGYDAVIVGTGSRALPPQEAYDRTRQAVAALAALGPRMIEVKYCSTFDSTAEGNIGPSLDAAMDETGATFTVALPALPINGRTTYMGHHFVHGQLLSDSAMRNHPLTPMRNSNLVSHLQTQTSRKVGLASYPVTKEKLEALRDNGVAIAILDCVSDADLASVCEAIAHLPLISGSSAPAAVLPSVWQREGLWHRRTVPHRAPDGHGAGYLVVAGSCSVATRGQNEWFERNGAVTHTIDPLKLVEGEVEIPRVDGHAALVRTQSSIEDISRVHAWARNAGLSPSEAGLRIADALARVVLQIVESAPPAGLIVAGGETSGTICRTLQLGALEVGRNIEPGVPLCVSLGRFQFPVVLKSGNFGSVDFYGRAIARMQEIS